MYYLMITLMFFVVRLENGSSFLIYVNLVERCFYD